MPNVTLAPNLRCIIKASGSIIPIPKLSLHDIQAYIGAKGCDVVNLRQHGLVMIVDDTGKIDRRPTNIEATRHYHAICKPGTTYTIAGDVVIVPDADFAP